MKSAQKCIKLYRLAAILSGATLCNTVMQIKRIPIGVMLKYLLLR